MRKDEEWAHEAARERDAFAAAAREIDAAEAVELAANAWRLWMVARDVAGGRAFLGSVLARSAEPSSDRGLALYGDGLFAFWVDDLGASRARNEEAAGVAHPEVQLLARLGLSRVEFAEGDYAAARLLAGQAKALAGDFEPAYAQAPTHMHAQATRTLGDHEAAAALFTESLALNRRIDDPNMVAVELHNLGHVECHRGNADAAAAAFAEARGLAPEDDFSTPLALLNDAALAVARGAHDAARTYLAAADETIAAIGIDLAPDDRFELEWIRERVSAA